LVGGRESIEMTPTFSVPDLSAAYPTTSDPFDIFHPPII
jgi:hypothetical protein